MARDPFEWDHDGNMSMAAKAMLDTLEEASKERDPRARHLDDQRDATLTLNPEEWADNPQRFDYPGVDTGPKFREEQGEDFNTESFVVDAFEFNSNTRDRLLD